MQHRPRLNLGGVRGDAIKEHSTSTASDDGELMRQCLLIFALAVSAWASTPCGWHNDVTVHVPTTNYPTPFTPPAVGASYTDATGCEPTRITNALADGHGGEHVVYNIFTLTSADDKYAFGNVSGGSFEVRSLISGNVGQVIVPIANTPIFLGTAFKWAGPNGTGSALSDHDFYWFDATSGTDTVLKVGTVNDTGSCAPSCTISNIRTLHTFTGFGSNNSCNLEFAGGEGDISDDGNIGVFDNDPGSGSCSAVHTYLWTYNFSTNTVIAQLDYTSLATRLPNGASVFHDNRILVNWNTNTGTPSCPTGPDCYSGSEVYSTNLAFSEQLTPYAAHYVTGWYGSSVYYISMANSSNFNSTCSGNQGTVVMDIDTLTKYCSLKLNLQSGQNQSGSVSSKNGWVLTYLVDDRTVPNTASYPLAGTWQTMWGPYENELVLQSLAPSHDTYRVVQTRTCNTRADYWKNPFGSLSRDATLLLYNTDFCQNSTTGYSDMMLINLYGGAGGAGAVTVSGVKMQGVVAH